MKNDATDLLPDTLARYAQWLGYARPERANAWAARLEINRAELEHFRACDMPDEAMYVPRAAAVHVPNGGTVPDAPLLADAHEAWLRASRCETLHAFNFLPDVAPRGAPGVLSGVPFAVKDLMSVAGMPLTGGTASQASRVPGVDAEVVARLRRQGAVPIGMTNLHELAYGITSANPHFGAVVNPVVPDRTPGGSSGGSAAAVAAGVVRVALGTDTAGSIRIPAACCGVVGFKPSYDVLPRDGVMDLAPTLDHVGPIGARVSDCATVFAVMLGMPALPRWARASSSGLRIARLGGYFAALLDADVRAALDEACAALSRDGAHVAHAEIDGVEDAAAIQFNTICAEASAVHERRLRDRGDRMGEDVRVRCEIGQFLPGLWYVKAQRMRAQLARTMAALFESHDLLICPTLRAPAPRVGAVHVALEATSVPLHTAMTQLTMPFNLTGLPALSLPWGRSRDGVPIGLQIVGPRGGDWDVLSAAHRLESVARAT